MPNKYMVLVQEYTDNGSGIELVDNWYLKDTVYPGTLIFDNYAEALAQAVRETYDVKVKDTKIIKQYRSHVILCQETPKLKEYYKK